MSKYEYMNTVMREAMENFPGAQIKVYDRSNRLIGSAMPFNGGEETVHLFEGFGVWPDSLAKYGIFPEQRDPCGLCVEGDKVTLRFIGDKQEL